MSTKFAVTLSKEGETRAMKCILLAELQHWPTKSVKNTHMSRNLMWPQRNAAMLRQITLDSAKDSAHEMLVATSFKVGTHSIETRYGEWLDAADQF